MLASGGARTKAKKIDRTIAGIVGARRRPDARNDETRFITKPAVALVAATTVEDAVTVLPAAALLPAHEAS